MSIWKKKTQYDLDAEEVTTDDYEYLYNKHRNLKSVAKISAIVVFAVVTVVLVLQAVRFYGDTWLQTGTIYNVSVGSISLEGLTVEEANALLSQHKNELLPKNDITVKIADQVLILTYQDTKAELNVASMANTAYLHGRNDNMEGSEPISLDPLDFVDIDAGSVRALLKAFVQPFNGRPIETSAVISGERPDLSAEPTPDETNQILTITVGSSKYLCDPETIFQTLKTAHRMRKFVIEGETKLIEPEPPSAHKIFREFCLFPVDATIDSETSIITESSIGYGFDIVEVQKILDAAEEGEVINIPLARLEPSVTTDELLGAKP
ncbi:MAG: hypothetical protein E7461_03630 [Ruminococcaceae bacterium]|nr:hypothetical protein [Oscillospiraceae bacterium]